jgi:NAD(P)-dependent dehydrogenase (short-subunit alcohol dehydrogenase family)
MTKSSLHQFALTEFRLDGHVALLSGAARGIGLAMARVFAQAGCAVAIQDIDLEAARSAATAITESGGRALALGGDIADATLPAGWVQSTTAALGAPTILVNNASVQRQEDWLDLQVEEIESQLRANVVVPLLLCQACVPGMRAAGYGRILNIGSIQALRGNAGMLPYAVSKGALETLTKSLARAEAACGITINDLAPGWYDTDRNKDQFESLAQRVADGKRYVPLGRLGLPRDCAGLALLLCSPAGAYITGQTIYVDGGMSVR